MSISIKYQFIPSPTALKNEMWKELSANNYKVMDYMLDQIFSFPETRESLMKRFSCRFIAKALNINFSTVGRILKKLSFSGFITIMEKGKKKIGSLIKINLEKFISCTDATKEDLVSCTDATNKRKVSIKKKQQTVVDVVNSTDIKTEGKKLLEKNIIPCLDTSSEADKQEAFLEFTPPTLSSIPRKVLLKGIEKLQERRLSISENFKEIGRIIENKSSTICNKIGYFVSLCENFIPSDLAGVSLPSLTAPVPPVERKTVAPNALKTQEYCKKIEQEKEEDENHEKVLQTLKKKYPDEINSIIKEINQSKQGRFCPAFALPILYLTEYRKRYPDHV